MIIHILYSELISEKRQISCFIFTKSHWHSSIISCNINVEKYLDSQNGWGSSRLINTICLNHSRLNPSLWFRKFSLFVFCFLWLNILLYFLCLTGDERWMKSKVSVEHFWLTCSELKATTNLTCLAGGAGFSWGISEVFLLKRDFAKVMMIFSTRNPAPSFFHQSSKLKVLSSKLKETTFTAEI